MRIFLASLLVFSQNTFMTKELNYPRKLTLFFKKLLCQKPSYFKRILIQEFLDSPKDN